MFAVIDLRFLGSRRVRIAVLRQPRQKNFIEFVGINRLGDVGAHPGGETGLAILIIGVGGQSQNWRLTIE